MNVIKGYPKFLIDNGLVFEINRKVLHQFGLAMVVDVDRNNKKQLVLNLLEVEDLDGLTYDEESFFVGSDKYSDFVIKSKERLAARQEAHGFLVQEKI